MPFLTPTEWAAVYAGINILILLALAFMTVSARQSFKVALGDGGHPNLQRAIRAHANAAEYIPAGIAGLILLAWLQATPAWLLHAAGVSLTLGRILHGIGLSAGERNAGRMFGTLLTWVGFGLLGFGLIAVAVFGAL
ncbi:MAG: MAPEG family protein [Alphaproteobacteria bacterium]|jgi:uncharacterized membrane protein YecN with MAPEG domain|nr:MAPEG family protein [Alphaproteobacteria bacterium]